MTFAEGINSHDNDGPGPKACPICHGTGQIRFLCRAQDYQVFTCAMCQGDFVAPTPSAEFLQAFYSREAWFEGGEPGGYQNYDAQTAGSVQALQSLFAVDVAPGSVLDVGCGYGTHLEQAAAAGWTCFGIEISDHARGRAQERLAGRAEIAASLSALQRRSYDLVLLLDVIEHLGDPYPLFADLAARGALSASTRVVVTTPNAGADEALQDPAQWQFRHPPSHLTYYSDRALRLFLQAAGFAKVRVEGLHPTRVPGTDESGLARFAGLFATATDFIATP